MRGDRYSPDRIALYACGGLFVIWFALLIAPVAGEGLPGLIRNFGSMMEHPLRITFCEDSLRTVLICLAAYGLGLGIFLSSDRNYRRREEHGSARWGNARTLCRKYADREDESHNKILTQNVSIGLEGREHGRNLNVLVCGGSGSGKTRYYAKANILNCNSSLCILDPKITIIKDNICRATIR